MRRVKRGAFAPAAGIFLAAGLGCFGTAKAVAQADLSRAEDAMAFIRVVGDLRLEYQDARPPLVRRNVEVGSGSGFVIAPSGLVLTSLHVVDAEPSSREGGPEVRVENPRIQVFVGSEGSEGAWEAHVVASDAANDLAALQVTALDLPYLPFGDSDAIEAGRPVRVLGFPFGRQTEVARRAEADVIPKVTVTAGSFAAARADEQGETRFLQTDAAVQPGNSGGPMLDEDGYVVGVVKMKLSATATSSGAGFTVPVNIVKDFLDASSLLDRLPVARLRPGVRHSLDWKRVSVELPDGFQDRSPLRLVADGGEVGEIGFRVERVATDWRADALEEALLGGGALAGFVPGTASVRRQQTPRRLPQALAGGKAASRIGSAAGRDEAGREFRVEYAIVDLGKEKVVARHLGPSDAVAFNLGLVQRSLASLEAAAMLIEVGPRPLASGEGAAFEPAPFPQGPGQVPVPSGWVVEPASEPACAELQPAEAGLSASHPSDYTLVLRALRLREPAAAVEAVLARCGSRSALSGAAGASAPRAYGFRFDRLGVAIAVRSVAVPAEGGSLLLELSAPLAKLPVVDDLFASWVRRVSEAR
jgi:S1-C subfamily serine protease